MEPLDLGQGIVMETPPEIPEETERAIDNQARREAAQARSDAEIRRAIIAEARASLLDRGEPFDITVEMVEHGLRDEIMSLRLEADFVWKLKKHFQDEDDEPDWL